MESFIRVKHDPEVDAVYVTLRNGDVARTVEVTDSIYMDVDGFGHPLGIEFLHVEDFAPYVHEHGSRLGIPESVLNQREWAIG